MKQLLITIFEYLGVSSWLLLLIPLVLLVRLLVRRSRWSILRMTLVSLTGVAICALWMSFFEALGEIEPMLYSGRLGVQLSGWLTDKVGGVASSFTISTALLFLWIFFTFLDAIVATVRFFIYRPYVREVVKEKKPKATAMPKTPASVKAPPKTTAPQAAKKPPVGDSVPEFKSPSADLLKDRSAEKKAVTKGEIDRNIAVIKETLADHRVTVDNIEAIPGPTVTLYKVYPAKGVKVSAIRNLADDVSVALKSGKVLATLMKDCVGLEVANRQRSTVSVRELMESREFRESDSKLPVAIGLKVTGEVKEFDLAAAPHLLVAGATGQGKSVGLNVLITSLLYSKRPSDLKFVFIDPKKTEFSRYSRLYSHYLAVLPEEGSKEEGKAKAIAKEPADADRVLRSLCQEMNDRYTLLEKAGTPEIKEYNALFKAHRLNPNNGHKHLPYIVCIIDEYGQLVYGSGGQEAKAHSRSIMTSIVSLASMGRAAGIHLVIATQTPRREVVSGLIKTNFPMSIAFKVKTDQDSRVILDEGGADKLLGNGDMLISKNATTERVQCGYISSSEMDTVSKSIEMQIGYKKSPGGPYYLPEVEDEEEKGEDGAVDMKKLDDRFEEAARTVVSMQRASTSYLQTTLEMGFARSARVMYQLEAAGIVGPQKGSKQREVLIESMTELESILNNISHTRVLKQKG